MHEAFSISLFSARSATAFGELSEIAAELFLESLDDIVVTSVDENRRNLLADVIAPGDGQQVILTLYLCNIDQIALTEKRASLDDRTGDFDFVPGQPVDQFSRS